MLQPTQHHVFAQEGWKHNLGNKQFGCVLNRFHCQNPGVKAAFVIKPTQGGLVLRVLLPGSVCLGKKVVMQASLIALPLR